MDQKMGSQSTSVSLRSKIKPRTKLLLKKTIQVNPKMISEAFLKKQSPSQTLSWFSTRKHVLHLREVASTITETKKSLLLLL